MLAQLAVQNTLQAVCGVLAIVIWTYWTVRFFRKNEKGKRRILLGIMTADLVLLSLFVLPFHVYTGITYVQEIGPRAFLTDTGKMALVDIPRNIGTTYEYGDPTKSGYTVRWLNWVKVERINAPYDWRIAKVHPVAYQTDKQLLLVGDGIVDKPSAKEECVEHCQSDNWWRKEHPGKPQSEIVFLETPPGDSGASPRLRRLIFDR